jgi:hypothetical protein
MVGDEIDDGRTDRSLIKECDGVPCLQSFCGAPAPHASHGCRFCLCLGVMPEAAHSEQYAEPLSEALKYDMLSFNPGLAGYCRSSLMAL